MIKLFFSYLPSFIVLLFSMIALFATVSFLNSHDLYIQEVKPSEFDATINVLHSDLMRKEFFLYWSVIILGFSGFVLALVHARRLVDLKKVNYERKANLDAFQIRVAALEASRDGVLIFDHQQKVIYVNNSLCLILGLNTSDKTSFFGHPLSELFSDDDYEILADDVFTVVQESGYWVGEFPIYRDDHSVIYTELSVSQIDKVGFVATMVDVTYRHDAEEEKKILQDQFYQAQKMEAIGRLAGGIAHDFNNILASMNGYAEFLIEDLDDTSEQHGFASNILQAGMQAKALVNKMLAFSRKDDDSFDEVDVLSSLEETVSMLKATLSKTIDLHHESSVFSAHIKGSATHISQLLMNLSVNAQDAMDDHHGRLDLILDVVDYSQISLAAPFYIDEIGAFCDPPMLELTDVGDGASRLVLGQIIKNSDYVRIRVEDTGSGMPKQVLEHIFDPFFTTKSAEKGTGLGLATAHSLIASHKGCMIVNTKLLKGTCFDLYFPLIKSEIVEVPILEDIAEISSSFDRSKKCILLVEDQEDVRVMMMKLLNRIGYNAISATSGRDGLEVVREELGKFDLIITDQNMPEMTGLEMINSVHAEYPDIPFLMVSGYSEAKIQEIVQDHPAVRRVLKKPVTRDSLTHHIDEILDASNDDYSLLVSSGTASNKSATKP